MSKDPAVLFYTQDFLTGVMAFTMEERGQYITLLCMQHQGVILSEKTIRLTVGSVSVDVLAKFKRNADGSYFHQRMADEIENRKNFVESRRNNGKLGGRPKKNEKPNGYPNAKPIGKATENLIEDEDVNANGYSNEYVNADANVKIEDIAFLNFWEVYGYKKDKPAAAKAWKKLTQAEKDLAMDYVADYLDECKRLDRPLRYPATYLNQKTWENEIEQGKRNHQESQMDQTQRALMITLERRGLLKNEQ